MIDLKKGEIDCRPRTWSLKGINFELATNFRPRIVVLFKELFFSRILGEEFFPEGFRAQNLFLKVFLPKNCLFSDFFLESFRPKILFRIFFPQEFWALNFFSWNFPPVFRNFSSGISNQNIFFQEFFAENFISSVSTHFRCSEILRKFLAQNREYSAQNFFTQEFFA